MLAGVRDPGGETWVMLEGNLGWEEREGADIYDGAAGEPIRRVWLQVRSYLVDVTDVRECWKWLGGQNFMGRWMPEGADLHEGYLGEYPWATPFAEYRERSMSRRYQSVPVTMIPTASSLAVTYEMDSYQDGSIGVILPAWQFFRDCGVRWDGLVGYSSGKSSLRFDFPALRESGRPVLLASRDGLMQYLHEHKRTLVWTALGEKMVLGKPGANEVLQLEFSCSYRLRKDGVVMASKPVTKMR
jgi:hypothetical protein